MAENALDLAEPTTSSDLREWAYAKRLLEVVDVGEAYRDVFHPGKKVTPNYVYAGQRMLRQESVGKIIKYLAPPALMAAGVEREFALRRLIETIEADITDYADGAGSFMNLDQIRAKLPPEKRRLIRRYKEQFDKEGNVTSRTIELEPKHQALELLARIQQLVQPNTLNVVNNETIVNVINVAQQNAAKRQREMLTVIDSSKTGAQLSRATGADLAVKALPPPEKSSEPAAPA
jgi:hypothetical protein